MWGGAGDRGGEAGVGCRQCPGRKGKGAEEEEGRGGRGRRCDQGLFVSTISRLFAKIIPHLPPHRHCVPDISPILPLHTKLIPPPPETSPPPPPKQMPPAPRPRRQDVHLRPLSRLRPHREHRVEARARGLPHAVQCVRAEVCQGVCGAERDVAAWWWGMTVEESERGGSVGVWGLGYRVWVDVYVSCVGWVVVCL